VDDATAQATLADVHAHSQDYRQQAVLEFQAVLEKDSGNVVANRGLGYLYLYENQFDKAATMFRRAALADPKDAQLHYLSALLMNREAMKEGKPPDNPLVMRQELEAAIALDPTMADAYNLLAFALSADGKLDAAIANQKKAIELNPSLEHYQSNLARLYLQAQKWDDAEAILSRLKLSSDPTVRDNASQNLAAMQANKEMAAEALRARELRRDDITAPQWRRKESASSTSTDNSDEEFKPDNRKVLYLYGRIQSVDCSADPVAVLTVKTSNKLMRLRAENYKKLLVMGADEFSCGWRDQKVLVNYKAGGKLDGDVVTVELQAGK
jgi:Flp pilus assembly protein TadD